MKKIGSKSEIKSFLPLKTEQLKYVLLKCSECGKPEYELNEKNQIDKINHLQYIYPDLKNLFCDDCMILARKNQSKAYKKLIQENPNAILLKIGIEGTSYLNAKISDFDKSASIYMNSLNENHFCLIFGKNGSGKTHLAAAYVRWLITEKYLDYLRIKFIKFKEFITRLSDSKYADRTFNIDRFKRYPVLILDDIMAQKIEDWELNYLIDLIEYRYTKSKKTIITTDCTIDLITTVLGKRITSRLLSGSIIELKGRDRRL